MYRMMCGGGGFLCIIDIPSPRVCIKSGQVCILDAQDHSLLQHSLLCLMRIMIFFSWACVINDGYPDRSEEDGYSLLPDCS